MQKGLNDTVLEKVESTIAGKSKKRDFSPPSTIARSWQRCIESHGLQPEDLPQSNVLSKRELVSVTESCAEFLRVAERGVTSLQHKMWPSGYAILLANANGATLTTRIPTGYDDSIGKHLIAGACWSEKIAGTNGIGTCLLEREPITVHKQEHFLYNNGRLSCSAAPIFSPLGDLLGCLNATTTARESNNQEQLLSLQLVYSQCLAIEDEFLRSSYRDSFLITIHFSSSTRYSSHPVLLGVNEQGRIVGANSMGGVLH